MSDSYKSSPLLRELNRAGLACKRKQLLHESCLMAVLLLGWLILWHLSDLVFVLSPVFRKAVTVGSLLLFAAVLGRVLYLALRKATPSDTARILESYLPELRQDVSTVLQWRNRQEAPEQYSRDLVQGLEERAWSQLNGRDLTKVFKSPARKGKYLLTGLTITSALLLVFSYPSVWLSFHRFSRPYAACGDWSNIIVEPGNARLTQGQELAVRVLSQKQIREKAYLITDINHRANVYKLTDSSGVLAASTGPADSSFSYRIMLGRRQSRAFKVEVYRPLMLGDLRLKIVYPSYTGIPPYSQENDGNAAAVKGSLVRLSASVNQPLSDAGIVFDDGRKIKEAWDDSGRIKVEFPLIRTTGYRFWAVGASGDTLMDQVRYMVTMLDDALPAVKILSPPDRSSFNVDFSLQVEVQAGDDYGLERVELHLTDPLQKQILSCRELSRGITDTSVVFVWQPKADYLLPGDSVLCLAQVRDNDQFSGPKLVQSEVIKLFVPTREDAYRQQAASDSLVQQQLSQARNTNRSLKQEIERLSQAIKENRQMDWQQKAAVEEALRNQEQLVQKMEQAAREGRQQSEQNAQGLKFDLQTMEKLAELRELFEQVATEEMRKAMEQIQQALDRMDRREMEKALEKFKLSQEEFQQRLDAAIAGLKDLQQEQMLASLRQEVDEMARQQKAIKDGQVAGKDRQQTAEQARRQQQLAADLESIQKRLEELSGQMQERNSQMAAMMEQAGQRSCQQQTSQKMRQAGRKMEEGQSSEAAALQQEALVDLTELAAGLQNAMNNMGAQRSKAASRAMRQKAGEILDLSRQQEELNRQINDSQYNHRDLASRQQILQRQAARLKQKLDDMTRRNFMLSPQAGQAMQEAIGQMGSSGQSLSEGRRQSAGNDGRSAQAALNQAAMALIQSSSRSGGSSGSGDMMHDLEGLSGIQQHINQASQGLVPMSGGEQGEGLSQQARSQMARLAAEQEAVRQGMEDFNREYGRRGDRTGRLDDLVSEMEKVIRDLKESRIDRQTIERQEKILSRMLSAGSSLREQETSQQRQAEPGKDDFLSKSKPKPNTGQPGWRSAPELKNWRSQPYPLEYRQLLEEYFRLLAQ